MKEHRKRCLLFLLLMAAVGCEQGQQSTGSIGNGGGTVSLQSAVQTPETEPAPPSDHSEALSVHRVFKPVPTTKKTDSRSSNPASAGGTARKPQKPEIELLSRAVGDLQRMLAENHAMETTKPKSER